MRNAKKTLAMVLAFVLVAALSIAGTVAFLARQSNQLTNTFTVGKVELTLDEAIVDLYGEPVRAGRTTAGCQYKLIPGHKYTKDPTVHVAEGSEPCWLAAKVENGLSTDATIAWASGWTQVGTSDVWVYGSKIDARDDVKDQVIFSSFTFGEEADPTSYSDAKIVVTAYAIQAEGFDNATEAYNATFGATP